VFKILVAEVSLEKRLKSWIEEFDAYAGLRPPLFTNLLLRDPSLEQALETIGRESVDWQNLKSQLHEMRRTYHNFIGFRLIVGLFILAIVMGIISALFLFLNIPQRETSFLLTGAVPLVLLVIIIVFGDWLVYRQNMHKAVKRFRQTALEARRVAQTLINRLVNITEKSIRLKLYYPSYDNTRKVGVRAAFNPIMTKKHLLELRKRK